MKNYGEKQILQTDVMLEILCRLPPRFVGRFRTFSKLYYWLLSQPFFIKEHLKRHVSVQLVVQITDFEVQPKRTMYIYYTLDNNNLTEETLDSSELDFSSYEIVDDGGDTLFASCNGLFCKLNHQDRLLTLWNPTTKKVTCLPQFEGDHKFDCFRESYSSYGCMNHYAFGYDELSDDYKIVCVVCVTKKGDGLAETPLTTAAYIYSHRRGSWKEIQPFPPYCIQFAYLNCQFVNGKFHWVAYASRAEYGEKEYRLIVSLDLATERYGTVPLPPTTHCGDDLNVCVLGGELCFYIDPSYIHGRGFEMWMMREYGVAQSWFQLLSIPLSNLQYGDSIYYHKNCVPLYLMQSGEILFLVFERVKQSISLYNPKTCEFITVNEVTGNACVSRHIYVESLVETAQQSVTKVEDFLL